MEEMILTIGGMISAMEEMILTIGEMISTMGEMILTIGQEEFGNVPNCF